jgi:hypothetical protein
MAPVARVAQEAIKDNDPADVLRSDFDESKVTLLAQAWKLAHSKAKSLGWLKSPRLRRRIAG